MKIHNTPCPHPTSRPVSGQWPAATQSRVSTLTRHPSRSHGKWQMGGKINLKRPLFHKKKRGRLYRIFFMRHLFTFFFFWRPLFSLFFRGRIFLGALFPPSFFFLACLSIWPKCNSLNIRQSIKNQRAIVCINKELSCLSIR